jgi:hypothetical protein
MIAFLVKLKTQYFKHFQRVRVVVRCNKRGYVVSDLPQLMEFIWDLRDNCKENFKGVFEGGFFNTEERSFGVLS